MCFPFFSTKEPDKATAKHSTSASPNTPWAQLDTASVQPTANTSPEPHHDIAAAHTFTQECLWSWEMMDIFSWCYPSKNKQTHTPSDSPVTWLLLGGGKPHPVSRKITPGFGQVRSAPGTWSHELLCHKLPPRPWESCFTATSYILIGMRCMSVFQFALRKVGVTAGPYLAGRLWEKYSKGGQTVTAC